MKPVKPAVDGPSLDGDTYDGVKPLPFSIAFRDAASALSGYVGETCTAVFTNGKVILVGEEWNARSKNPFSVRQRVCILRVILELEKE